MIFWCFHENISIIIPSFVHRISLRGCHHCLLREKKPPFRWFQEEEHYAYHRSLRSHRSTWRCKTRSKLKKQTEIKICIEIFTFVCRVHLKKNFILMLMEREKATRLMNFLLLANVLALWKNWKNFNTKRLKSLFSRLFSGNFMVLFSLTFFWVLKIFTPKNLVSYSEHFLTCKTTGRTSSCKHKTRNDIFTPSTWNP